MLVEPQRMHLDPAAVLDARDERLAQHDVLAQELRDRPCIPLDEGAEAAPRPLAFG